ncbi:biotin--[acetyl-CoA-carboxylase] ligase [Candidatus Sumerlaeota bacterium]|nr:biotin--[acetyl-CoA-carboxylase] ligase [Candidatus Sumerlaeota bacterium]
MSNSRNPNPKTEEITEDALRPFLTATRLGRVVHAFKECESTNLFARRLVESERRPEHGTLIVADHQRAGRGRHARGWCALPGQALLFTLILHAPQRQRDEEEGVDPTRGSAVTMAVSVGVARALRREGIEGAAIKWPNDVLASSGRKLCGILIEQIASPARGRDDVFVAGVGINVNQTAGDFPSELCPIASSIRIELGKAVSRLAILARVLEEIEKCLDTSPEALFRAWERLSSTVGKSVRIRQGGRVLAGTAQHLEPDGRLVVRMPSGDVRSFHSAEIEELRTDERTTESTS